VTMTDTTSDGDPYHLVSDKKQAKKPRTDHAEHEESIILTETSLRITFKKPVKHGTEINVAATVKQFFTTMKSADPYLLVFALDRQASYRPSNDDFPTKEDKFKQFFLVHPQSNNPAYKNHLTIGCILKTSKPLATLKESELNTTKLIDWLTANKIFIEADHLGHATTKVVGFLLRTHPRVVHRDALKETLTTKLQQIAIAPQQVIDLDQDTSDHYQRVMDSGDHIETYVPPYEIFSTVISNTHEANHVSTRAIGIKCNTNHHPLLSELFSQLFTHPPTEIAHIQFSLSGILTVIGNPAYQNLIRDNNKYFNNLATIPIAGITNDHLELDIQVANPKDPNHRMTIREIILANDWCCTVETTHTDGRLLLTTTRHHLHEARQWLDQNLEPLFTRFLPKNLQFQPHTEYPIPRRTDRISVTATTKEYAAKLLNSIPNYGNNTNDKDKFSKFPMKHQDKNPKYVFNEKQFPTLKPPPTNAITQEPNPQQSTNTSSTPSNTTVAEAPLTQPKKPFDLKALQELVQKNLSVDFNKLINARIDDFQADTRASFTKIDHRYDELSTAVSILTQQQQRMHNTLENMQNNLNNHFNHPSPSSKGDGHA